MNIGQSNEWETLSRNYHAIALPLLKDALQGRHKFAVKIGKKDWQEFDFYLNGKDIDILEQPMGAVMSASKDKDGNTVLGPGGRPIVEEKILVCDGGFGTFDAISIYNRAIEGMNSFVDVGMRAVFARLSEELLGRYGVEVSVHAMQQALESGAVMRLDRKTRSQTPVYIDEPLRICNKEICAKALDKLDAAYDFLSNYRYLLVTGGTCASWLPFIRERYANMSGLKVITGDQNDSLGPIFSNARGYYIYRVLVLRR